MPLPAAGSGPAISKDLRKYVYVLYLSAIGSGASYPAYKLGNTEPVGGWTRQGRLTGEDMQWNVAEPSWLEGRVGFTNILKFRVVNKAEIPEIKLKFDEADPAVQAMLRGTTYNSLSSGPYTGEEFLYVAGKFFNCQALLIGTDVQSTREHHVYSANAVITYQPATDPSYEGLTATLTLLVPSGSTESFRIREWD